MKILLMAVGKTTLSFVREGIDRYLSRLQHYVPTQVEIVPDVRRAQNAEQQKTLEGQAMLSRLQGGDKLILLDERGKEMTSMEFAGWMERQMASGSKRLVLAVGGPYGFSPEVYGRADGRISLSRMTLNHEMVRMFVVEQLYRAQTILRGEPYHHE